MNKMNFTESALNGIDKTKSHHVENLIEYM